MKLYKLLALALIALVLLAAPVRAEEEDAEEVADLDYESSTQAGNDAPQAATGGEEMSPEMEERVAQQRKMIDHIMANLEESCQQEFMVVLQTPAEQQSADLMSEDCKTKVQGLAREFITAQQGGEAPEAANVETPAPVVEEKKGSSAAVVAQVLLAVVGIFGGVFAWVVNRHKKFQARLDADPALRRRLENERKRKQAVNKFAVE